MKTVKQIATRCITGLPYLQKDLARRLSLRTGAVLTTPMTYYIIFSGKCNLECSFCTIYKQTEPTLSAETMLRIVREAKLLSGHGFNISISGGEPMIYQPIYEVLGLAQRLGVDVGITTNGLALTRKNVKKILALDPFNINVSLESIDPRINESLRPFPDGTRRTLDGIEAVLVEKERTGARVSVIVKPTIMEQNYRHLPDLVRYFGKDSRVMINFQPYVGHKGDPFWIQDLSNMKAVFSEILALQRQGYPVFGDDKLFEGFAEYFANPPTTDSATRRLDLKGKKRNCDIGLRSMFIQPNGDVFFCDFLEHPIGNVHHESLSEIYYGTIANKSRRQMVYCDIDCQQTCKRPVPLWVKARAFLRMG